VAYSRVRPTRVWRTLEYDTTKEECTLESKRCLESVSAPTHWIESPGMPYSTTQMIPWLRHKANQIKIKNRFIANQKEIKNYNNYMLIT